MNTDLGSAAALGPRQQWMQVLARAGAQLQVYGDELRQAGHRFIRPPEVGMVMVRGRIGGSGGPFNLGEMTVTRCVVQLTDGQTGHSYVAGRSKPQAELAALADAHLQGPQHAHWMERLIAPLHEAQRSSQAERAAHAAATKVDFTTLVRGED
jgi:alpha-D-ribose 1-methylphosphonate 5-triphosphate synthase subunit PhnG